MAATETDYQPGTLVRVTTTSSTYAGGVSRQLVEITGDAPTATLGRIVRRYYTAIVRESDTPSRVGTTIHVSRVTPANSVHEVL